MLTASKHCQRIDGWIDWEKVLLKLVVHQKTKLAENLTLASNSTMVLTYQSKT